MVMEGDEVIYSRGFGYADLENKVRIDDQTMFRLASVSKQFTTMAIMLLAEQGRLDYDDLLVEYIPEFESWPEVTLRHLMHHTSGIPDYYEEGYYSEYNPDDPMPQPADIVAIMQNYPEPDFEPGERSVYNNAAYEVLVAVVERVSGQPFSRFVDEQIFKPAGMLTATTFNSSRADFPGRAFGYAPADDGFEDDDYDIFNDMLGSGGVYASLQDMAAWVRALRNHNLVNPHTLNEAWTRGRLNDGRVIDEGFGWGIGMHRGHRMIYHGGAWVGFRNLIALFPDNDLTVVLLGNRADFERYGTARKVAELFLPEERGTDFRPDESQASVIEHQRRIPDDDHWWNVRGPEMGWMHRHTQQMFPTVPVYRAGQVRELAYELNPAIGEVKIDTPEGPLPFDWFIHSDHATTVGVVVLHKGRIAYEAFPRMQEYEKFMYWSVAKVLTGAVVRLLEEQGKVDISKPIEHYVPRLADSVHAGTTVQNLLDMATGVDCAENYTDPESCYYIYSEAIGDNLRDGESPDDPYEFMATVDIERTGPQGEKFVYSGATNFLLMWLVEEVTGYTLPDAVTKEFWTQIGAEGDAGYIAYRYGIPLSHGGFFSSLRDFARFGLLYTPSWSVVSDKQIISDDHLAAIMTANRPGLRPTAYSWGGRDENGYIQHGGWGGQGLYVNPEKDIVAVFTSYTKEDQDEVSTRDAVLKVLAEVYGDD